MSESPLLARWHQWQSKVDGLKVRERALVLLTALAIVYMIWDIVIFNPLAVAKADVDEQVQNLNNKIAAMQQEEQAILSAVNADPDRDIKQQVAAAQDKLTSLNESLAELSLGLVPVEQLAIILRDVLRTTDSLELIKLRTLPVEAIAVTDADANSDGEEKRAGVYKHQVLLEVKGNYRELLVYLHTLESMNWRFYWEELHFAEERYPNAIIQLQVYTLSTDEGLFGV